MPRLFVGNFQFEHELAEGTRRQSAALDELESRLALNWVALANQGDLIYIPPTRNSNPELQIEAREVFARAFLDLTGIEPQIISRLREIRDVSRVELVPWGWTSSMERLGLEYQWECSLPPLAVVRKINSRVFRWLIEQQLQIALPGSAMLSSVDQLEAHLQICGECPRGWVLKANFGMSGRERILGRTRELTDSMRHWITRRSVQSGPMIFEPWLERIDECGIQWDVPQHGPPELIGVLPLITDNTGAYRGSYLAQQYAQIPEWQEAIEYSRQVATIVQQEGYFGPLGTDAMRYRDSSGKTRVRPLQDLNGRYTMGRLAWGLMKFLKSGNCGAWVHDLKLVEQIRRTNPQSEIIPVTGVSWFIRNLRLPRPDGDSAS